MTTKLNDTLEDAEKALSVGKSISKWIEGWQYKGLFKLLMLWVVIVLFAATFLMTYYCYSNIKNGLIPSSKGIAAYQAASERGALDAIIKDRIIETRKDSASYALANRVEKSVNDVLEDYRLRLNADRVVIAIFHDTEKMSMNLHFRFFSYCYEHVAFDRHISEIAEDYQKKKTSLFPIYSKLGEMGELYCSVDSIEKIDIKYAHRLQENNVTWVGLKFLRTRSGTEIGVLKVSWRKSNLKYKPSTDMIKELTREVSQRLEALFDLNNPSYNFE